MERRFTWVGFLEGGEFDVDVLSYHKIIAGLPAVPHHLLMIDDLLFEVVLPDLRTINLNFA